MGEEVERQGEEEEVRLLFAGTDEIAVPTLEALASQKLVGAVLTTPDAPGKRGSALLPSPVKAAAVRLGLPVLQPDRLGSEARKQVSQLGCDVLLSFCYGKIFGPKFLSLFPLKFNIHPSLLPHHRGCSPIQAAILGQDRKTGISIQDIALAIDEGDIYITQSFELDGTETTASLCERVSKLAPVLALNLLEGLDVYKPRRQLDIPADYTGFIKKEDGRLDFTCSAAHLHAQVRACYPWPKAHCLLDGSPVSITSVYGSVFDIPDEECAEEPGTVVAHVKGQGLKVATGHGYLYINGLQAPTKKEMDSASFINGRRGDMGRLFS